MSERLDWLMGFLGLESCPDEIRYQLLHRTASALLAAQEFNASGAIMLIHSFSPTRLWFEDFVDFAGLFGARASVDELVHLGDFGGIPLWIGWCCGDQRFRERV